MVLLEAEAYGLPIIAFDCKTGPRDLVTDGENGYLVENANIKELANTMLSFTKDRKTANRMSEKSRNFVTRFNLDSVTHQWETLIEEVLHD
jgi:glycosyltransferase involved in cell wall biosynthesis